MAATRHRWPNRAQTGIAETLQSDSRRVVAHNRVVPHKLKEFAAALGCWLELRFEGQFLKKARLLFCSALHELTAEFRLAPGIDPIKTEEKAVLRLSTDLDRVLCGAHLASRAHGNAVRNHEVNKLNHAGSLGSRSIIRRNNHFRQALNQLVVLRRE